MAFRPLSYPGIPSPRQAGAVFFSCLLIDRVALVLDFERSRDNERCGERSSHVIRLSPRERTRTASPILKCESLVIRSVFILDAQLRRSGPGAAAGHRNPLIKSALKRLRERVVLRADLGAVDRGDNRLTHVQVRPSAVHDLESAGRAERTSRQRPHGSLLIFSLGPPGRDTVFSYR
jgi:hypothetical protein